jgi:serine/threonine-protein kinase
VAILIGHTLAQYRITAAIGAGGMGEVYRATDTKLGRDVALKLLPEAFAADPDRLARFEREAKVLASLNHPGIAHLYGFESARLPDGSSSHFLAMELVEGEDLAARLKRGAIPVDEAVAIAKQVAEALEEAHEKGIVHRDLKPANVKVTPDGKVKVLDFGLAKAFTGDTGSGSSADLSQSPTLAQTGTAAGIILGTAAYMSPEQARGKPVDKRADVWAFGVVLFEMVTGHRLFTGDTVSDVLAAVLTREPDWTTLPPTTPPRVRHLLGRCLERDAKQRLRDIGEARVALGEAAASSAAPSGVARATAATRWATLALVAVAAAGAGIGLWTRLRPAPLAGRGCRSACPARCCRSGGPDLARRPHSPTPRGGHGVAPLRETLDCFEATVVPESEGAQAPSAGRQPRGLLRPGQADDGGGGGGRPDADRRRVR